MKKFSSYSSSAFGRNFVCIFHLLTSARAHRQEQNKERKNWWRRSFQEIENVVDDSRISFCFRRSAWNFNFCASVGNVNLAKSSCRMTDERQLNIEWWCILHFENNHHHRHSWCRLKFMLRGCEWQNIHCFSLTHL